MYPTSTWYRVGNILINSMAKGYECLLCDVIKTRISKRIELGYINPTVLMRALKHPCDLVNHTILPSL